MIGSPAYGVSTNPAYEGDVAKQPVGDDSVGRMQFMLTLRRRGIGDAAVLRALDEVPREHFVGQEFQDTAYADQALPIACGQTISQPYVVAYMTEQLDVQPQHKVLEVGTGSGYQAAVLSRLVHEVVSIERYRSLLQGAEARFKALGLHNITTMLGDGHKGWPAQAPFERIIVTAASQGIPEALLAQLAVGGIMVLPVEVAPGRQELQRVIRTEGEPEIETLLPVSFVPLVAGAAKES